MFLNGLHFSTRFKTYYHVALVKYSGYMVLPWWSLQVKSTKLFKKILKFPWKYSLQELYCPEDVSLKIISWFCTFVQDLTSILHISIYLGIKHAKIEKLLKQESCLTLPFSTITYINKFIFRSDTNPFRTLFAFQYFYCI